MATTTSFPSQATLTVYVSWTVLGICAITILSDVLTLYLPKFRTYTWTNILWPFHNFLTLDDLRDAEPEIVSVPPWKRRALGAIAVLESAHWLAYFVFHLAGGDGQSETALASTVVWAYAALRTIVLNPSLTPPYLLLLIACIQVIAATLEFTAPNLTTATAVIGLSRLALPVAFIFIAGTLPLSTTRPVHNVAHKNDVPSVSLTCPEDAVDLWSWAAFSFVEPVLSLATSRRLDGADIWSLSPYFSHKNLFEKCLQYRSLHPTHSLLRFLLASNSLDLILDLTLELWGVIITFLPPWALRQILAALSDGSPEAKTSAYYWTVLTFLVHLWHAQADLFQRWHTRRCYERTRGQLFCTLHYKSLKRRDLSGKPVEGEEGSADLGKIVNLMQGDAYAVAQRFWEFSGIFAAPVRLILALGFLYNILGWSALAGVAVVIFVWILNYPLAKYNIYITRFSWKAKDRRMSTVNELLQNIRFLKFSALETAWKNKALDARETELEWRVKDNIVSTLTSFIWTWMPSATALVSFLCYTVIAEKRLTLSVAFPALALFSQLQQPMTQLPGQVFAMLHAYVSMQRIEAFLNEGDVADWASTFQKNTPHSHTQTIGKLAFVDDACFEWYGSRKPDLSSPAAFVLGPLNIEFPQNQLTLIAGATASGKTSLLASLLGEMHCLSGSVIINKLNHEVAYCAQNPWLEHATIRDNILFGSDYDEERYQKVIHACSLTLDLEIFEAGDMTEVGEKGITLSGGQRARIALARAFYSPAKCILLDDPLAAVDMHTAQHLVEHCLSSELASARTIVLVTHHISICLSSAAYLVELSHGEIIRQGSVRDLENLGILQKVIEDEDMAFVEETEEKIESLTPINEADIASKVVPHPISKPIRGVKLIEEETRAEGRVSLATYTTYFKAAGILSWILTIVLMLSIRAINIGNQFFLASWGAAYDAARVENYLPTLPSPDENVTPWLLVYFYISIAGATTVFFYIGLGYYASLQASRSLFKSLLERLTKAPPRFYDTTPLGRILNRFTADIGTIDGALNGSARAAFSGTLGFVASFCVIVFVVPTFAPFAILIAFLYIRLAPRYVRASRDLRRLESVSLSPAFSGFDELLRGLPHVRSFGMEDRYQDRFYKKVDTFQSYDHAYWLVAGWLRWRYDCLGSVVVFAATLFALYKGIGDGATAVIIVQAGVFAEASRQVVSVLAQLELDFNSVERIVEYLNVPQEAPSIGPNRPPAYWPSNAGELVVDDLVIRYAPELSPALNHLSFTVKSGEKIGVVGRTGSGKSTLALALLRMVNEPTEGRIIIDGVDIATIGLDDLRSQITIVSQDVSIFEGTLRSNIDPCGEFTDKDCWDVMDRCHLTRILARSAQKGLTLEMPISSNSLSAGEAQLISLVRAILRRRNIIIFDEATSQIDSELDDQIQQALREELPDAIVIAIAHRLKTVINFSRILVLHEGKIVEYDTPKALLQRQGGVFREMCRRSPDWPFFETMLA